MSQGRRQTAAALTIAFVLCFAGEGQSGGGEVLEEFDMPPCLDMLTVPVSCSGEVFDFLLDTGASICLADKSLAPLLGEPVGRTYAQLPTGVEAVELYLPLQARVGDLEFDRDEPMPCLDLSRIGRGSGKDIKGIVGMSFIRRYALQLDFDRRAIRFLRSPLSPDGDYGVELELELVPHGSPMLTATIVDTTKWSFALDTGCGPTGSVDHATCERLRALDVLHPVGLTHGGDLTRSFTTSLVVLDSMSVGPFAYSDLMLSRTATSVLGLPFLSRQTITFDFPERRVWFRPSSVSEEPPCFDLSGLVLAALGGECVVVWTAPGSPASELGLEQGDAILSVDGVPTAEMSIACIDEALCRAMGDTLVLVASRRGDEFRVTLDLRWEAAPESTLGSAALPEEAE